MDLHQIHMEDVFGPSLRWVWMLRSKVKVTRDKKRHFSALSAACMQFMFGKTSSASCFFLYLLLSTLGFCLIGLLHLLQVWLVPSREPL